MTKSNSKQPIAGNGERFYTIYVGKVPRKAFSADESLVKLLRKTSPFFAAKFDADERVIKLPTFEPEDFESYTDWLHARRVNPRSQADFRESTCMKAWHQICQAYMFGEHIEDYKYCDVMADVLAEKARTASEESVENLLACVEDVFDKTTPTSLIPNLVTDTYYMRIFSTLSDAECKTKLETLPKVPLFIIGLWEARSKNIRPPWLDTCQYHRHKHGEPCLADTEISIWKDMCIMWHDWRGFISTNVKGIHNSYQAFQPCISSTHNVLKKLGAKCKAAFSWFRALVKANL